jgi:N utilization substance protein B
LTRRLARELAMKTLFAHEFSQNNPEEILPQLCEEMQASFDAQRFSESLVQGVIANQSFLDKIIKTYAVEWDLERIAFVDKNIMRIALYEIIFSENTPVAVAINEAIEIAKIYSGHEAPRFINGILGKVINDLPELRKQSLKEN